MSGQTYKADGRSALQIQLKTGSGVNWSTVGSGSGWVAELRPEGSPSVTAPSATFNITVSGATMTLTLADPSPLLRGPRTTYGWALYDGAGAPILTDMAVELHDGYTHPSGTPSPSGATPVGTYTVDLGSAVGNLVTVTAWTGPQGPAGPPGPAGGGATIDDTTASTSTVYSSTKQTNTFQTQAQVDARVTAVGNGIYVAQTHVGAMVHGASAVWLGDSVMSGQGNDPMTPTTATAWGLSMPTYATYLSKGGLRRIRNAGVPGNTSAQMLSRFDTDVTPFSPSLVVIMAGTNDSNDASPVPIATYASNMQALVAKTRGIGATPVLCTLPPNNVSAARRKLVINYNAWLRDYCKKNGIVLVDIYSLLVDPATGDYLTAYGSAINDHTHPINPGYVAMGQTLWNALAPLIPPAAPLLPGENTDANNLLTNGLFLTSTGAGTSLMPTGWTVQGGAHPAGVTGSLVTGDTAIKGNWWKLVADGTATALDNEYQTVSGIVPGHKYAHVGRFKATGMRGADSGSGSQFLIGVAFNSTLNNAAYDFRVAPSHSYDVADGGFYQEMVAPSDASTALVRFQLQNTTAGAGTLQLAQLGFYDLTAMGLA